MEEQKKQEQESHSPTAEFVPYELAVKLKALGFDEPCFGIYLMKEFRYSSPPMSLKDITDGIDVLAPTFSQAFRWFREEHQIEATPCVVVQGSTKWYNLSIIKMIDKKYNILCEYEKFETYEEAELACLNKLIEIVESKSE